MSLRAGAERWLNAGWYGQRPILWLIPLTAVYALLLGLRDLLRRLGWQRPQYAGVPVLVVGNLTVGGTGKTPFVVWLCERLREAGRHPGVVSRGHGGRPSGARAVAHEDAAEYGDEAVLLARRSGAPVWVGRDRLATARALRAAHPEVDVLIADDGLGHRRLGRDLEVVMLDGARGLGNRWWLPAGPLREPAGRLREVGLVVATGQPCADHVDAPVMHLDLGDCVRLCDGARRPLAEFRQAPVHAVAGIGNPQRFFRSLEVAGLSLVPHAVGDHARFDPAALAAGSAPVLMTEKDACRLGPVQDPRLWMLPVSARFLPHDEAWILDVVQRALTRAEDGR